MLTECGTEEEELATGESKAAVLEVPGIDREPWAVTFTVLAFS